MTRQPGMLFTSGLVLCNNRPTVNLIDWACLDFHEFVILGLFARSRTRELSILMTGSTRYDWAA